MSDNDPTIADRMARYEAQQQAKGITKVCVRIPLERAQELREIAAQWRAEAVNKVL